MKPVREISYGLCMLQLKQGDVRFIYGDERFAEITGYEPEEVTADCFSVKQMVAKKARKELIYSVCRQMKERNAACVEVELLRKDFKTIHARCYINRYYHPAYGEECVQVILQDVTQERMNHLKMQNQIEEDAMTHLYNKKAIERIVNRILDTDVTGQQAFYLIDIDNFKYINDTFGHVFGDTVIQDLAAAITRIFPERARIGRIGGDEFVVFFPDTDQEQARVAADQVNREMRREIAADLELVQISCSVGVAMCQKGDDYQNLVRKADAAMYFAKDSGKDQSAFFQEYMMTQFMDRRAKHNRMQRAQIMEQAYDVEFVFFAYNLLTDSRQFDSSMNLLMDRIVERFDVDRASVLEYQKQDGLLRTISTGANTSTERMGETESYMELSWLEKNLDSQGDLVANEVMQGYEMPTINNYVTMPKSFVICSIRENGAISGCVTFYQYWKKRAWSAYETQTFHELAKAIAVFVSLKRDKQKNMEKIHRLATRDKVTGLLDQKNFEKQLGNYIRHCREFNCLALVYVDINNFSYVNERYGTGAGDEVLSSFAGFLMDNSDTLLAGRLFSDCFLELHINENKEQAIRKISERHEIISGILRQKYPIASLQFKCGIYFLEDAGCSVHEAIENANMARKNIKEDGRTSYCIYGSELRESRGREQEIIAEFLECKKRDALELYLQPSFQIGTRAIKGVEAFCRWHNDLGLERRPGEIVPILKKNGYILEWDMTVYEKVLGLMSQWKRKGVELPLMEINFSTADFQYAGIARDIVSLAERYGISPDCLAIELSEHGLRRAPKKVSYIVKELKKNGFKIAIDNFGGGYSSLEILANESVDVIKTGRELLHMGKEQQLRSEYLRYIRSIVHSASKEIIFVGAENKQQEQEIRECGYNIAQGYLYERELPAEVFETQYIRAEG